VGIRLTPYGTFLDCVDSDPIPGTVYLLEQLNELGLAYVHLVEGRIVGAVDGDDRPDQTLEPFRKAFKVCRRGERWVDGVNAVRIVLT
jgi:hypothetical protein